MPDLYANVSGRSYGKSQIGALTIAAGPEALKLDDLDALADLISFGAPLTRVVDAEGLKISSNTVTLTWHNSGNVAFYASPDHATVTSYTARLRLVGSETIVDTSALGKPTPDGNNVIVVSLASFFSGQAAGNYTISILATDGGGSTDSAVSNAFTLPLP